MPAKISVIIPTLNEAENIVPLIDRIAGVDEIIFIDDGSTDGTCDQIRDLTRAGVRLIERRDPQFGLAGAVLEGARAARGEILVVMDADLSHPPESISSLVRPVEEGAADMAIGSRYVAGGTTPGWPVWRRAMSRTAAAFAYPLTRVHDSMGGFFAIRRNVLLAVTPQATGFKIAFETIVRGGRDLRVLEVPIVFCDRTRGTSKMSFGVALTFFVRWLAAIVRLRTGRTGMPREFVQRAAAERVAD